MVLSVKGLTSGYFGKSVIKNIDFTLQKGHIVCVLGPNGVGKSTLFKALLKLKKYSGDILIDGDNIKEVSRKKLAKRIAYVPQSFSTPFGYTVEDVLVNGCYAGHSTGYKPSHEDYVEVKQLLDQLDMSDLRYKEINHLSGGQRQLIMVGRALLQKPKILLMDEPTANLDFGNTYRMMNLIQGLAESGMTILMNTHNPKIAQTYAHEVMMLKNGSIYQFGCVREVMQTDHLMSLYQVQTEAALQLCL